MWRIKFNKFFLFLFVVILGSLSCFGQDKLEKNYRGFYTLAPRIGFGIHEQLNFEIGLSGLYIDTGNLEFGAASIYSTFIAQQTSWDSGLDSKGFKIGVQSSFVFAMWGLEYKQLFYNQAQGYYLSPKMGLSILDIINIEYAINILDKEINESFPIYSRHQVSINFSLNKKIYKDIYKGFIFN